LGQWIQVDLGKITMITKIATQGIHDKDMWVTEYMVSYSLDGGHFRFHQQTSNKSFVQVRPQVYIGRTNFIMTHEPSELSSPSSSSSSSPSSSLASSSSSSSNCMDGKKNIIIIYVKSMKT